MSSMSLAMRDSKTMLGRNLKRWMRYPSMTLMLVGMPIVMLLLFVYVFGGTLGAGIGGASGGRAEYLAYVTPGILLMTVTSAVQGTAISVTMDMTEGIIARFRTMAIARTSVLTGHVLGSIIQSVMSIATVLGVAVLIGFRPIAGPIEWLALAGFVTLLSLALVWIAVAVGMACKAVESAGNVLMPLMFLPFLGSGFVPTDSMPTMLRWFAEYQPFTPVIETIRGLLMGTTIGHSAIIAIAWCLAFSVVGYLWSRKLYNRDPSPS